MDDDDILLAWNRNGGTESNQEAMDSSSQAWDCLTATLNSQQSLSSQESDLTAMNPWECTYQPSEELDVSVLDVGSAGLEATSKIPSVDRFPGASRFHIDFEAIKESHFYSTILEKIFVMRITNVPIKFVWDWRKCLIPVPNIRAVLLFQSAEIVDIIESCPVHLLPNDEGNLNLRDESHAKHVLRCDDSRATYCTDQVTGRHSVVVPLDPPQAGAKATTIMFSLGCLSTCLFLKRRPTQIVFTLEDALGQVFGRDLLHVQVSASPKRDMRNAEGLGGPKPAKQGSSEKRRATPASATNSRKRVKPEASSDFMTVPVLDEAHRERVLDFAHGDILLRIDKEQRVATPRELQLIASYTNAHKSNEGDT